MDIDFLIERTILRIGNCLLNKRSEDLKEHDLTANQSETLLYFDAHPGNLAHDLKDYLKISHQAARDIVARMRQKGLLTMRVSDQDGRAREVFLTEKGRDICRILKKKGSSVGSNILQTLDDGEKQELWRLLEKISRGI